MERALLAVIAFLLFAAPANAFDTGPHVDITRDALMAEGIPDAAIEVVQVTGWFNDLYDEGSAEANPHANHHGFDWLDRFAAGAWSVNPFPPEVLEAAGRSHFDSSAGGYPTSAAIAAEWDRLGRRVRALIEARRAQPNRYLRDLPIILGISLHQVQDFYAHSNWVEPAPLGPDWAAKRLGWTPTWFDVAPATRLAETLYVGGDDPSARGHGVWNSDRNRDLATAMNKDWPGRPRYEEAYVAAYFATRQWVRAVRAWAGTDYWASAMLRATRPPALAHDLTGMREISIHVGHWQGQGEPFGSKHPGPGGSIIDARDVLEDYFTKGPLPMSVTRARWQELVVEVAAPATSTSAVSLPCSLDLQATTWFVRLGVTQLSGDLDPAGDDSDFYVTAGIAGQQFLSAMIHGKSHYSFVRPNAPFTFLKAVADSDLFREPLTSLEVEVKTADVRYAGTDDNVYLRINDTTRFLLDKRLYNDFERGDRDRYSLALDDLLRAGIAVGDIRYLQLEKAPDGSNGGWKLDGLRAWANGQQIYERTGIDRWLEDSTRTWRAPGFTPVDTSSRSVPVWIALWDDDDLLYGNDDHADINPRGFRWDIGLAFDPRGSESTATRTTRGGSELGGRASDTSIGEDEATLHYRLGAVPPKVRVGVCPAVATTTLPATTTAPATKSPTISTGASGSKAGAAATPAPATVPAPATTAPPAASSGTPVTPVPVTSSGATIKPLPVTIAPPGLPDLTITDFGPTFITVKNRGTGAVGYFNVLVGTVTHRFRPLAAGETVTRALACKSGTITARLDPANLVAESDEANNAIVRNIVC